MKPSIILALVLLSSFAAILQFSRCEKEIVGPNKGTLFERNVLLVDDYFDSAARHYGTGGISLECGMFFVEAVMSEMESLATFVVDWVFEDCYGLPARVPRE